MSQSILCLLQGVHEVYAWRSWVADKICLSEAGCSIDKHQGRIYFLDYVYPWPRQTKLIVPRIGIAWGSVCVQVRYALRGLIAKDPVHEQTLVMLYSSCFCRLIILISFNFWSVVRVVSGKISFTALLCIECNLFLRTSLHLSHTTDAKSMWGLMWALKNSFLVSMSTMYLNFDRRKTRIETVLHTLLVWESQRVFIVYGYT